MFDGELLYMIDWMNRKKRARAIPELGRNPNAGAFSEEFQTMRQLDNRFYWLSTDEIQDRNTNDPAKWRPLTVPAVMQARIHEGNQITIHTRGLKNVTVWLGSDSLLDFDKPLTIRLNQNVPLTRTYTPSLKTLLEDFYQRGDRQRLFLIEIPFKILKG
jgi:hypothetical protein